MKHRTGNILLTIAAAAAITATQPMRATASEPVVPEITKAEGAQQFAVNDSRISRPGNELRSFAVLLDSVYRDGSLRCVTVTGTASPDGPLENNNRLAQDRAKAVRTYLSQTCRIPLAYFYIASIAEDWDKFNELMPGVLSASDAAKVRRVVDTYSDLDERERKLRALDGGRIWTKLLNEVMPRLRAVSIVAELEGNRQISVTLDPGAEVPEPEVLPEPVVVEEVEEVVVVEPEPEPEPVVEPEDVLVPRHWYLKTNLAAWLMAVTNIQAEMDVVDHMSVMLPIYYSGWDYFKSTLKFRTFTVLPEVRYWVRPDNQGFFLGAHGGFSYYNIALDKATRYQDHDGNTPAWGGGLTIGYRLPIRGTSPWQFEFSAGYGIYTLDYDTFHNYHNGLKTGRHKRTFYGLDNFAVTLSYRFNQTRMRTQKKGGAK